MESPWERIRALKARTTTPLALALRGRFLVGSRPFGRRLVRRFVASAAESGIEVFRLHDPLNDVDEPARGGARRSSPPAAVRRGPGLQPGSTADTRRSSRQARRLPELGAARVLLHDPAGSLAAASRAASWSRLAEASGLPVGIYCQGAGGNALAARSRPPVPART